MFARASDPPRRSQRLLGAECELFVWMRRSGVQLQSVLASAVSTI